MCSFGSALAHTAVRPKSHFPPQCPAASTHTPVAAAACRAIARSESGLPGLQSNEVSVMRAGAPFPQPCRSHLLPFLSFLFLQWDCFESDTQKSSPKKKRGGVRLLAAARLLLRVRARSPRRYLTACCFTLPGLPFGSVMGSVRSRKPGVHVVHICRRAYSAAAMGCLIMWQWCEEVCKDFFKGWRRGSPPTSRAISQWQAGANRRGRALSPPESNMASHSFKCFSFSS